MRGKKLGKLLFIFIFLTSFALFLVSCTQIDSITIVGEDTVEVGDEVQYTAVIEPSSQQSSSHVIWSVENGTGSASIDSQGNLTAIDAGTITVKAKVGTIENTFEVTIIVNVDSVTVVGPDEVMLNQQGIHYDFSVNPENATYESIEWAVLANTGSATITQDGILTPVTAGTVTVRASVDGINGIKVVTILTPISSVEMIGPSEVRLDENPTYTIEVEPSNADIQSISWSVTDETGSATITQEGEFTPISTGTVTIAVEMDDFTIYKQVEIIVSVDSITVNGETTILPNENPTYTATVFPVDAKYQDVTWRVTNGTGEATISDDGVLTPVSSGTVTVVATADGKEGTLEVQIEQDDRLLGTPRPTHLLATPENTIYIDGVWEEETDVAGLDVTFARQVYDISFDVEASKTDAKVIFSISDDIDLSRMQYFAIKVTGYTTTSGVNPTVSVNLKDFNSGLFLYNDQQTEIEVTEANQWIVFGISNRYRLQTPTRELKILVDPHFTASGNVGELTIQQVVFFGDADPVTEPQLLTPLKNAHWETNPVFTAETTTDVINGETVSVIKASATAEAVSGWRALPAYVLEDISRKTTISFMVKLLTQNLESNPKLMVTLGDNDIQNITITRPAVGEDAEYQVVTVQIPASMRTEANMWAARYVQLKPNSGGGLPVEYYIYDFKLTGDADPEPIVATRTNLGGDNIPLTGNINYVENGSASQVPAGDVPAYVLFEPNDLSTLSKLEFGYNKTTSNASARSGMNGVYVKIQGPAGVEINIQQGWSDSWADESQRRFVLNGTVQEIYILALNRSSITTGTGWFPFEFSATMQEGMEDVNIQIFEFAFTAILPEEEPIIDQTIYFNNFIEGGNTLVNDVDTMTVSYDNDGNAIATVVENNIANHIVGIAVSDNIRYMNKLTIQMKGEIGTSVSIKLAYGNMFNYDVDYVHTFTTNDVETIEIDIIDRDALKASKISLSIFLDTDEGALPSDFTIYEAYFSGQE